MIINNYDGATKIALSRDDLWRQLANAVAVRSSRDQVLWTQSAIFWAANAVLLAAFFQGGETPKNKAVGLVISSASLAVAAAWSVIQNRLVEFLRVDEALIHRLEERLNIESDLALSPDHNVSSYNKYLRKGISAKRLLKASGMAAVAAWLVALLWVLAQVAAPGAAIKSSSTKSPTAYRTTPNPSINLTSPGKPGLAGYLKR